MNDENEFSAETPELAECAKINFENLEKFSPVLKNHPMYVIAKAQLDEVVKRLNA